MDYPLTQPGLDLYLNKFSDGVPGVRPASVIPSITMNALLDEAIAIITAAGLEPSEANLTQMLTALRSGALVYGIDTGAANACTVAYTPAITALTDGMVLRFKAKNANTGAATLNINGLGASPVVGGAHSALQGGEIVANGRCQVIWNATLNSWVLIECTGGAMQVSVGTQTGQAANVAQVTAASPAGKIAYYAMFSAPTGWLKANGALISRSTYAALFAAIGTTFGVGDGSTTFSVPDLRGEFARGWDDGRGIDAGRVFGSWQQDMFQGHVHAVGHLAGAGSGIGAPMVSNSPLNAWPGGANTSSYVNDGVGGTPRSGAETRPRNIALLACIKY